MLGFQMLVKLNDERGASFYVVQKSCYANTLTTEWAFPSQVRGLRSEPLNIIQLKSCHASSLRVVDSGSSLGTRNHTTTTVEQKNRGGGNCPAPNFLHGL